MIKKFEVGRYYRGLNEGVHSECNEHMMLMFDGIPRKCVGVTDIKEDGGMCANFEGIEGKMWWWALVDMEEVSGMEKMRKIKEELMGK